ncbi:MAG: hypothetical protein R3E39_27845 [Anaerolineae bacterium]
MKICLLLLGERPVNTRYPCMLAEMINAEVVLPPVQMLAISGRRLIVMH